MARLKGQDSEGQSAPKRELARRAKVGYCPCCAALTRVAAPLAAVFGSLDVLLAQGMQLCEKFRSRGRRNLAARSYNMMKRYLPVSWRWAAAPLGMDVPDLLSERPPTPPNQRKNKPTAGREPSLPFFD